MTDLLPCPRCGGIDQTEALAQWMHERGIATGHGETVADLLTQLSLDYRRAPALRWRSEPPDVPGWWWQQSVERFPWRSHFSAAEVAEEQRVGVNPSMRWAGPIPQPEEGEE